MTGEIQTPLILCAAFLIFGLILSRRHRKTGRAAAGLSCALILFLLFFVRNPERIIPDGGHILAPADGRITAVQQADSLTRVAIFLSLLDVHVNRIPCDGRIVSIRHVPGQFRPAFSDRAGSENERMRIVIETAFGEVTVTQVAGMIARRIVCRLEEGQEVRRGDVFGMIKLGSRVELELPGSVQLMIKEGDRVKAGETRIGLMTHGNR